MPSIKLTTAALGLFCLLPWTGTGSSDSVPIYVLRLEGPGVPTFTYVGATTGIQGSVIQNPPVYGGLAFWGPRGLEQARVAAQRIEEHGAVTTVTIVEVRGPMTDIE